MENTSEIESLKHRIQVLENQRNIDLLLLKEELNHTIESLRPANLNKNALPGLSSTVVTDNLISSAAGLAAGYVSKKIIIGKTKNTVKQFLGLVFQFAIAGVVVKNANLIKAAGSFLIKNVFKKIK
jgi:hypothetical protein